MRLRRRGGLPLVVATVVLLVFGIALAATLKSVQVKSGVLRSTPSFMGKIVAEVAYGDQVEAIESRNGWTRVTPVGKNESGWIHDSALTHKRIELAAGTHDVQQSASGDEIALAGKGFNEQVERKYRQDNPKLDFSMIDQMERIDVSDDQMRQFLADGQVRPEGGAKP